MPKWPQTAWHFDVEPPKPKTTAAKQRQPYFPKLRQAYQSEVNGKWIATPNPKRVASAPAALEATASSDDDATDVKLVHLVAALTRAPLVRLVTMLAAALARAPLVRLMAVLTKAPLVKLVKAALVRLAAALTKAPLVRLVRLARLGAALIRLAKLTRLAHLMAATGTVVQAKPLGKLTQMFGLVRAWILAIKAWIVSW